jgi:hypothetical protein
MHFGHHLVAAPRLTTDIPFLENKMKKLLMIISLVLLCGCAAITVANVDGPKTTRTSIYVPAWPWQNSQQIVERFNLSSKTNAFTLSLKSSQTETGDTNFWTGVGVIVGAAVKAGKTP